MKLGFDVRLRGAIRRTNTSMCGLARILGVRPSTVSRWCHGAATPNLETRMRIVHILGDQFQGGTELWWESKNDQVLSQVPQEVDADTQGRPGDPVPQLVQDVCPAEPAPRVPAGGGEGEVGDPRGQEGTDPADHGEDPPKALKPYAHLPLDWSVGLPEIRGPVYRIDDETFQKMKAEMKRVAEAVTHGKIDMVEHPAHYTKGKIEVIDIMESIVLSMDLTPVESALTAQVVKYIARWKNKGGVEDLKKCRWYLERLIGKVES